MNTLQAVALGIIQGLTEFLPVSSSGHLVLLQNLFGMTEPELLFDISLHVGTLIAVCLVFSRDIGRLLQTLVRIPRLTAQQGGFRELVAAHADARLILLIVLGNIPTVVLGLGFHRIAGTIFGAVWIVGVMLLTTGTILWWTRRTAPSGRPVLAVTVADALVIGCVQGLAILPGISRSGATIAAALFLGVDRELAGRFSFLLSIPAIFGALILELNSDLATDIPTGTILLGTLVSAAVGYGALLVLLRVVRKGQLHRFAPYCWFLGSVALIWNLAT